MISLTIAHSPQEFELADMFCKALGEWDCENHQVHGIAPEVVKALFHGTTAESLASRFTGPHAAMLIASWDGAPAGCVAYEPLDDTAHEIHKFYVAPAFRKQGIGRALMQAVFDEIDLRRRERIVLQTSLYMPAAISIYRRCGFVPCPPFHPVPEVIRATEVFMSRDF